MSISGTRNYTINEVAKLNVELATERGNLIHKALYQAAANDWEMPDWVPVNSEIYVSIHFALKWLKDHKAKKIYAERRVQLFDSRGIHITDGIIDLFAEISINGKNENWLIDYKTEHQKTYDQDIEQQQLDWSYQLSAYAYSLINHNIKVDKLAVIHMPRQSYQRVYTLPLLPYNTIMDKINK